jgi:hypothetical protein
MRSAVAVVEETLAKVTRSANVTLSDECCTLNVLDPSRVLAVTCR